jgi:hypothetical protein
MSKENTLAKVGKKVEITRRNGGVSKGVVESLRDTEKGTWVTVNVGDKKKPDLVSVRASQLRKAA